MFSILAFCNREFVNVKESNEIDSFLVVLPFNSNELCDRIIKKEK